MAKAQTKTAKLPTKSDVAFATALVELSRLVNGDGGVKPDAAQFLCEKVYEGTDECSSAKTKLRELRDMKLITYDQLTGEYNGIKENIPAHTKHLDGMKPVEIEPDRLERFARHVNRGVTVYTSSMLDTEPSTEPTTTYRARAAGDDVPTSLLAEFEVAEKRYGMIDQKLFGELLRSYAQTPNEASALRKQLIEDRLVENVGTSFDKRLTQQARDRIVDEKARPRLTEKNLQRMVMELGIAVKRVDDSAEAARRAAEAKAAAARIAEAAHAAEAEAKAEADRVAAEAKAEEARVAAEAEAERVRVEAEAEAERVRVAAEAAAEEARVEAEAEAERVRVEAEAAAEAERIRVEAEAEAARVAEAEIRRQQESAEANDNNEDEEGVTMTTDERIIDKMVNCWRPDLRKVYSRWAVFLANACILDERFVAPVHSRMSGALAMTHFPEFETPNPILGPLDSKGLYTTVKSLSGEKGSRRQVQPLGKLLIEAFKAVPTISIEEADWNIEDFGFEPLNEKLNGAAVSDPGRKSGQDPKRWAKMPTAAPPSLPVVEPPALVAAPPPPEAPKAPEKAVVPPVITTEGDTELLEDLEAQERTLAEEVRPLERTLRFKKTNLELLRGKIAELKAKSTLVT